MGPILEEPRERPRRNKGIMVTGIVLTSVAPVAAIAGGLVNTGGDQTAKNTASVVLGVIGTTGGVLMTVYGALRISPEEMQERERKKREEMGTSALVPTVSVGLGSVQAAWTF